jgi:hypothetical protein
MSLDLATKLLDQLTAAGACRLDCWFHVVDGHVAVHRLDTYAAVPNEFGGNWYVEHDGSDAVRTAAVALLEARFRHATGLLKADVEVRHVWSENLSEQPDELPPAHDPGQDTVEL